jgi:peroxiredoxin
MPFSKYSNSFCRKSVVALALLASISFSAGCDMKPHVARTGEKAPEISGTDIHGALVSLSQSKGKVVVIYFWTNSCCAGNLKQLEPYYSRNKDKGLTILAINEGNSRADVEAYARDNGLSFTLQTDEAAMTSKKYGVFGFPTIFIVDREGIIREKILGQTDTARLEKIVTRYLD